MSEGMHEIDDATGAKLAALADGSLAADGRVEVLRRVAASPVLAHAFAEQRNALAAVRPTESVATPAWLRAAITELAAEAANRHQHRTRPGWPPGRFRLASIATATAVVVAVVVLLIGREQAAPSVAAAARLTLAPAAASAPAVLPGGTSLAEAVDGLSFPDWANGWGWRAVGARRDTLRGREISTVIYADAVGRRIGYSIAAGSVLPVNGGTTSERRGLWFRRFVEAGGVAIVTWIRRDHTCILASREVDVATLLTLASYER